MTQIETSTAENERITIVSRDFTPAAMEFHRRRMGDQGYTIEGPIVRGRLYHVDGPGAPEPMLDADECFSVTFIRPRSEATA